MNKPLFAILALLAFAGLAQAACRSFAKDENGFPAGISPSVPNLSISVEKGGSTQADFELTIVGDQSQGLHFSCSVTLSAGQPAGYEISLQPLEFSTGGGFNKTPVMVTINAGADAQDAETTITITDDDRPATKTVIPLKISVSGAKPTATATQQPTAGPTAQPTQTIAPTQEPTAIPSATAAPEKLQDDTTKYVAALVGIAVLAALFWIGYSSLKKNG